MYLLIIIKIFRRKLPDVIKISYIFNTFFETHYANKIVEMLEIKLCLPKSDIAYISRILFTNHDLKKKNILDQKFFVEKKSLHTLLLKICLY